MQLTFWLYKCLSFTKDKISGNTHLLDKFACIVHTVKFNIISFMQMLHFIYKTMTIFPK